MIRNRCQYCGLDICREDPADAWQCANPRDEAFICYGADNGQHEPRHAMATLNGITALEMVRALLADDAEGAPKLAMDALHTIGAVWTCQCWQVVPAGLHCTVCGGTQSDAQPH